MTLVLVYVHNASGLQFVCLSHSIMFSALSHTRTLQAMYDIKSV